MNEQSLMNVSQEIRFAGVIPDKDCRVQWFQKRHPEDARH